MLCTKPCSILAFFESKVFHLTNLILVIYVILISFLVVLLILICLSEVQLILLSYLLAPSQAGVAAAACEVTKNTKY